MVVLIILLRIGRRFTGTTIALALILGGTIGNVWDRLRYGLVTDFLEVHIVHYHWPDFNVADSAIVIGGILLVLDALFSPASRRFPPAPSRKAPNSKLCPRSRNPQPWPRALSAFHHILPPPLLVHCPSWSTVRQPRPRIASP